MSLAQLAGQQIAQRGQQPTLLEQVQQRRRMEAEHEAQQQAQQSAMQTEALRRQQMQQEMTSQERAYTEAQETKRMIGEYVKKIEGTADPAERHKLAQNFSLLAAQTGNTTLLQMAPSIAKQFGPGASYEDMETEQGQQREKTAAEIEKERAYADKLRAEAASERAGGGKSGAKPSFPNMDMKTASSVLAPIFDGMKDKSQVAHTSGAFRQAYNTIVNMAKNAGDDSIDPNALMEELYEAVANSIDPGSTWNPMSRDSLPPKVVTGNLAQVVQRYSAQLGGQQGQAPAGIQPQAQPQIRQVTREQAKMGWMEQTRRGFTGSFEEYVSQLEQSGQVAITD